VLKDTIKNKRYTKDRVHPKPRAGLRAYMVIHGKPDVPILCDGCKNLRDVTSNIWDMTVEAVQLTASGLSASGKTVNLEKGPEKEAEEWGWSERIGTIDGHGCREGL